MISFGALGRMLVIVSRRGDLAVAMLVMVAIAMMIIPLPTPLVDLLIATNVAASALILLVAFYIAEPVELSSLPSIVLVATLFRLAITITTARLILLQADAGEIINAFGGFVIGGNIAVGLVIFLIITVAQFVVITKGSERVAEVAARFSLDALPGKQMSIDSDLRSGDIDQAEARRQRRRIGQESHLYGAMDGAMKFVRGDAIASLVVIVVNLVGGLAIGMMQRDLSLAAAAQTYSLLTVGDGLVAQIPALLVSVAAGTVVTRVASAERRDLGTEISSQLLNQPRALTLGAVIMLGLALIPGFPSPAFLALAAAFAIGSYASRQRPAAGAEQSTTDAAASLPAPSKRPELSKPTAEVDRPPRYHVVAAIGQGLAQVVAPQAFAELVAWMRQSVKDDLGVEPPPVELRVDERIEPHHFHLDVEGVPTIESNMPPGRLLVEDDPVHLELMAVPFEVGPAIVGRRPAIWVEQQHEPTLAAAGIELFTPTQVLVRCLSQSLRRYATQFVGIQETRELLARSERDYPELMKEALKVAPLQKIADILRRLLDENIPISNLRLILEAVVEWGPREQDVVLLVEYVRIALRRQICFRCADRHRVIAAYMLERAVEDTLRSSVRSTAVGAFLTISEPAARPIVERIRRTLAAASEAHPVVLASMDVRRHVRNLLVRNDLVVPVLSFQELAPEFSVQPLATIAAEPDKDALEVAAAEPLSAPAEASERRTPSTTATKTAVEAR